MMVKKPSSNVLDQIFILGKEMFVKCSLACFLIELNLSFEEALSHA